MSEPFTNILHVQHILQYKFDHGFNGTHAAKNICAIYGQVFSESQNQKWFNRFESGNRSVRVPQKSGRPEIVNCTVLKSLVEFDPCQSHEEMSEALGCGWLFSIALRI